MRIKNLILGCTFAGLFALMTVPAAAIPGQISISGYLADAGEAPVSGNLAWQVVFYANQTTTTQLGTVSGTALIQSGVFDLPVEPPEAILTLPEAWYSLAIDTDQDGIETSDRFADRFRISSVPFALAVSPITYFAPWTYNMSGGGGLPVAHLDDMVVTKFTTPPGGVTFNRMLFHVFSTVFGDAPPELQYAIAVYDKNGQRLYHTGTRVPSGDVSFPVPNGRLKGPDTYYIGWAANYGGVMAYGLNIAPGHKSGYVNNVISGPVSLPASFDPNAIDYTYPGRGMAVSFATE